MKSILNSLMGYSSGGFTGPGIRPDETAAPLGEGKPIPFVHGAFHKADNADPKESFVKGTDLDQVAAETVRQKVSELNAAIDYAARRKIRVDLDTTNVMFNMGTGETTYLTATILKAI